MQKNLKIATLAAAIFVVFVFIVKYFYTTQKGFVSSDLYVKNQIQTNYAETTPEIQEDNNKPEEQIKTSDYISQMEAFNYNAPIKDVDPKSLKIDTSKKLSYTNYVDRVRMASPAKLDANGLYEALMQAVGDNDIERAKDLIKRGAKLNSPDGDTSYAPIFWAISNGNVEMVDLLLKNGAKVNTPDEKGFFPIHWVIENSSSRPLVYQMKAIFDLLLDANPGELNRQDSSLKQTPIMMAINLNDKKAFAYLLDKGANIKIVDENKRDLLDIALENACHACISLIESKEKQNEVTPLANFASTFTAPDPIWLPYSKVKTTTKKKKQKKDPNAIVIQGDSLTIPTYKDMPDILPLEKNSGPNMIISD